MDECKKGYQHGNDVLKDENADPRADSYSVSYPCNRPWRLIGL
jgi:hypothetical protein